MTGTEDTAPPPGSPPERDVGPSVDIGASTRRTKPDPTSAAEDEPVVLPITDELDLHTFHPRDILDVVDAYLEAACDAGFREVRIVHGKGTGFQRERVRELLGRHPRVVAYRDAPGHRGHWGATIVELAPPDPGSGELSS